MRSSRPKSQRQYAAQRKDQPSIIVQGQVSDRPRRCRNRRRPLLWTRSIAAHGARYVAQLCAGASGETPSALVFTALCSSHDCRPARVRRDLRTRHLDVCPGQSTGWVPRYQSNLAEKVQALRGAATASGTLEQASQVLQNLQKELDRPKNAKPTSPTTPDASALPDRPIPVEVRQPDPGALLKPDQPPPLAKAG